MFAQHWSFKIEGTPKDAFTLAIAKMLHYKNAEKGARSYQAKYRDYLKRRIAQGYPDLLSASAVNCPPAGVFVRPRPRVCRAYALCPFCYVRGAHNDFRAISSALGIGVDGAGERAPAYGAVLAYRVEKFEELFVSGEGERDYAYRSFYEFFSERSMRIGGYGIRSREFKALGALGWLERTRVTPKDGQFRCEFRQLIALPLDVPIPKGFTQYQAHNDFALAIPFAAAMRYPQWLLDHEDVWPSVQYQRSRAERTIPLVLRGGCFRGASTSHAFLDKERPLKSWKKKSIKPPARETAAKKAGGNATVKTSTIVKRQPSKVATTPANEVTSVSASLAQYPTLAQQSWVCNTFFIALLLVDNYSFEQHLKNCPVDADGNLAVELLPAEILNERGISDLGQRVAIYTRLLDALMSGEDFDFDGLIDEVVGQPR